jgi:uncharacterized protein YodC (DUF2158 family)
MTLTTCLGLNAGVSSDIWFSGTRFCTMRLKKRAFDPKLLRLVADAEDFQDSREPPLRIGDWVRFNSGGPMSLVVDIGSDFTVAWMDEEGIAHELAMDPLCFHRVCPARP